MNETVDSTNRLDRPVDDGYDHVLGPDDARDMLDRQTEVLELIAAAAPLRRPRRRG